jgi:hypothetical protein
MDPNTICSVMSSLPTPFIFGAKRDGRKLRKVAGKLRDVEEQRNLLAAPGNPGYN